MPTWKTLLIGALAVPLVLFGVTSAAWAIDTRGDDAVSRGIELAGSDVGGDTREELTAVVDQLADELPKARVTIDTGEFEIETTAGDLGVTVDEESTIADVMAAGTNDPGPLGPLRWARSLVTARPVPARLAVDRATAIATLERLEGERRTSPVEPKVTATVEGVEVTPGSEGKGIAVDDVLDAIPTSSGDLTRSITITTPRRSDPPRMSDDEAHTLAEQAETLTSKPLKVTYGDSKKEIDTAQLRPGITATQTPEGPRLQLDAAVAAKVLAAAVPVPGNPTGVTFTLDQGRPVPVAGKDAVVCCAPDSPQRIVDAVLSGKGEVALDARTMSAAEGVEWASKLGVKELIGQFTTNHPAGQPRVKNIHRISDLTRGQLIAPGESFSVNDFVGERTAAKGFVVAPVIEDGEFTEDVGGGISQYATTLFNAAFFGGLDIPEYKAHSVYISRYPFGREATLAYPGVDLRIRNTTPHGVVIWPTYTGNSITVQLFSTKFASGEQTAQSKSSGCGRVDTTRTRRYVDGRSDTQVYKANYDCSPPSH